MRTSNPRVMVAEFTFDKAPFIGVLDSGYNIRCKAVVGDTSAVFCGVIVRYNGEEIGWFKSNQRTSPTYPLRDGYSIWCSVDKYDIWLGVERDGKEVARLFINPAPYSDLEKFKGYCIRSKVVGSTSHTVILFNDIPVTVAELATHFTVEEKLVRDRFRYKGSNNSPFEICNEDDKNASFAVVHLGCLGIKPTIVD